MMEIKTTRQITKEYNTFEHIAYKKWVAKEDILKRMSSARTSGGKKDNYFDIEKELSEVKENE